jgi:hypothetical protein
LASAGEEAESALVVGKAQGILPNSLETCVEGYDELNKAMGLLE